MKWMLVLMMTALTCLPLYAVPARIDNPEQPLNGIHDLTLVEAWRQGGEDSELFFGNVLQVLPAPGAGVYVLDSQLVQVSRLDAEGRLVGLLGGEGDGPGEVHNVNSIVLMPDGTLGIGQVLPGVVARVQPDGTPAGKIRIHDREDAGSTFVLFMDGWPLGEDLLAIAMRWSMSTPGSMTQEMYLRSYDLQGQPLIDFLHKSTTFDLSHFVFTERGYDFVWNRCGVLPAGHVVFAPQRDAYEIQVVDPSGQPLRTISRPCRPWRRDGAQKEEARLSHGAVASHYGREVRGVEAEDDDPVITALSVLEDGRLWVRTSRGDRDRRAGILTTLDEFDPAGKFVRQLQLHGPGNPAQDAIHILPDGRVVVVTGAVQAYRREQNTERETQAVDEQPLEVICYQSIK